MKKLLSIGFVAMLLLNMVIVIAPAPVSAGAAQDIWMAPDYFDALQYCDVFTVSLMLNISSPPAVGGLYGWEYKLYWEKAWLSLTSYTTTVRPIPTPPYINETVLGWKTNVFLAADSIGDNGTYKYHWYSVAALAPAPAFTGVSWICNYTFHVEKSVFEPSPAVVGHIKMDLEGLIDNKNLDIITPFTDKVVVTYRICPNMPPNHPTDLAQFKSNGVTIIPEGGTTPESTVVFKGRVSDPNGDQVRLEIELRQISEAFAGDPTLETISDFVPSGTTVTITRYGLVNADYKWQYRAKDINNATSAWTEFGASGNIDFIISIPTPPPVPKFLTLPFSDPDILVGWIFDPKKGHYGIDFIKCSDINNASTWQSFDVLAAADGEAFWAEEKDPEGNYKGWGKYAYIKHYEKDIEGRNYYTLYGHLESVDSKIPREGEGAYTIKRGQLIGSSGSTGVADPTWIHLHFEVHKGDARSKAKISDRVDPYDLNQDRDSHYGEKATSIKCGPNYLWTADPPTRAFRAILAQLITQEAIGGFPVTVGDQGFIVLSLKNRIDPITLQVVPDSGLTKVYVEAAENYPVSNPDIAQKIGLTDFARSWQHGAGSPESIVQKMTQVNDRWLIYSQIELEDAIVEAIPGGLDALGMIIGVLVDQVVQLIKEEVADPMRELKGNIADKAVLEAQDNYLSALKIAGDEIWDYEIARTYLQYYWTGEAYERAAFFLLDEIYGVCKSKIELIVDYLTKVVLGEISEGFDLLAFVDLCLEGKKAMDLEWEYYEMRDKELRRVQERLSKLHEAAAYTLELAQSPRIVAERHSPVELRVYDSQGRVTGVVDGEEKNEIPYSTYYENIVTIFFPTDSYRYEVAGTAQGTYELTVISIMEGEATTFTATDIPTSVNAIHQYAIDWTALSLGEEGVIVNMDSDGDGVFEHTFTSDSELSHSEYMTAVYGPSPDINGDGIVDILDIGICTKAFGSYPGDSRWNPHADINQDEIINIFDLVLIAVNFGKRW